MKPRDTHIALSTESTERLCNALNVLLATATDLRSQVKQAHWNVKGPQFFARHLLFDTPVAQLNETIDEMAERVATLGGYAQGTIRESVKSSGLPEYDLRASDGRQHIAALVDRFGIYAQTLRDGVAVAEQERDPATADLLTQALRHAERNLWFLESHIQS